MRFNVAFSFFSKPGVQRLDRVALALAVPFCLSASILAHESVVTTLPTEAQQAPGTPPDTETPLRQPSIYLGVFPQTLSEQRAQELGVSPAQGVYLMRVVADSPASKAGLKAGDVIVSINGQSVVNAEHFRDLLRKQSPGQAMTLGIIRDKQLVTLTVVPEKPLVGIVRLPNGPISITIDPGEVQKTEEMVRELADRLRQQGEQRRSELKSMAGGLVVTFSDRGRLGVRTQPLSEQLAKYFGAPGGLLITEVIPDSPAAKAGLRAGDCLVKIGDQEIHDSRDFLRELRRVESGEVKLTVVRDKQTQVMTPTLGPRTPQGAGLHNVLELYRLPMVHPLHLDFHLESDFPMVGPM
ncbi:MAG: PDZ domain-containing protein [Chloracidobacterium sp.]|uniref:PDZ domain-containing protein n=1 Tax=Chloracidobacterium validum TaxID=2821543 RepID=A0ABX8B7H9_9BACT|nr:PDZ domain-containing protein [Chloracidobacterium validum]QUW02402.1 PDZ domain-containing protein [Chloracidobacterium validum]